jgi:hypothetical protein
LEDNVVHDVREDGIKNPVRNRLDFTHHLFVILGYFFFNASILLYPVIGDIPSG